MATILVVDDEPDICDLLKDLLTDWGHTVFTALSADRALMLLMSERPEVVLLDRRMPGFKAKDFLERIKEWRLPTRVVVVTADVQNEVHEELLALGAVGVITKPFGVTQLKEQLERLLPLIFRRKD